MYGGMCHGLFTLSLIELRSLADRLGIHLEFNILLGESLITRGRNRIAHEFMQSDCTHLMFIDSDIQFQAQDVFRLIDCNLPIVAGCYPLKQINWDNISKVSGLVDAKDLGELGGNLVVSFREDSFAVDKPTEVYETGTGFMLIKRSVFKSLESRITPHFENHTRSGCVELIRGYFNTGVNEVGKFLSEDYMFCLEYRMAGGKVWVLPSIELNHIGQYVYKGSILQMARLEERLKNDNTTKTQ